MSDLALRLLASGSNFGPEVIAAIREHHHDRVAREELGIPHSETGFRFMPLGVFTFGTQPDTEASGEEPEKHNWAIDGF